MGKKNEPFEPRTTLGMGGYGVHADTEKSAVRSPVGSKYGDSSIRSLNMGAK